EENMSVCAIGKNGNEAVALYEQFLPDLLLMDIRMEPLDGLNASEQILQKHSDARILLLTTFSDDEYIIKALHLGARGYILKQNYTGIAPAIRAVLKGQTVFGAEITTRLPKFFEPQKSFDYETYQITSREFSIIELVADGRSNKEIAEALYLGEGTIRNYLSNILEKLELRDRTQLAVFYYQHLQ
ncbi:two component LuxR family transcriptional regulator, partial [gut metagenome]